MRNLQIVDDIVREAEVLVNNFYDDNATSFIFTADHGVSAVGNHGDGRECSYITISVSLCSPSSTRA